MSSVEQIQTEHYPLAVFMRGEGAYGWICDTQGNPILSEIVCGYCTSESTVKDIEKQIYNLDSISIWPCETLQKHGTDRPEVVRDREGNVWTRRLPDLYALDWQTSSNVMGYTLKNLEELYGPLEVSSLY